MGIGERIKYARGLKGISQAALARQLGLSPNAICLIESGRNKPAPATVTKLATALGIDEAMLKTELITNEMQTNILTKANTRNIPVLIAKLRVLGIGEDKIAGILELVC